MKVLLLFPPQAQPFLVHPAVPQLVAVLRREGIDAVGMDLNLEAHEHFLSVPVLEQLGMDPERAAQAHRARQQIRCGTETLDRIAYYDGIRILRHCLAHVSSRFEGLTWDLKTWTLRRYSASSWEDIRNATFDREANPFVDWFEARMDTFVRHAPDLVGISVAWTDQVIPAFTLARLLKKHLPGVHVCMGGSMITHLAGILRHKRKPFTLVDSFLPFEGEAGIVALARALEGGRLQDVPGLIFPDRKKVCANAPAFPADLSTLPVPDYGDFDLSAYYAPRVYLPVSASRGCYWGKCTFCSHHFSAGGFRHRSAQDVLAELDTLHARHGCVDFYFSDDALPPAPCVALADAIAAGGRPYRWAGELRLEAMMDRPWFDRLYRGGARLLLFGLESSCERVLDLMAKGLRRDTAARAIAAASEAGIITWVFFFLGFPGETRAEAEETLGFLLAHREHIDMVAGGPFALLRNSAVAKAPDGFGIEVVEDPSKDFQLVLRHACRDGTAWDVQDVLDAFRRRPESHKFGEPFVAEPHLLFFPKAYFRDKARR